MFSGNFSGVFLAFSWTALWNQIALRLSIVLLLFAASGICQAQDMMDAMEANYKTVAKNYRNNIRPYLSAHDREIVGDINFTFVRGYVLNAAAFMDGDQRKIAVSYGWIQLAYELNVAYAASGEYDKPQCFVGFIKRVADGIVENGQRSDTGKPLSLIPSFGTYLASGEPTCKGITISRINKNQSLLQEVASAMDCSLAWLIGHEVAHHINGDVRKPRPTLAQSRIMEAKADAWSLEHAFDIRINPLPAHPVLLLYSMIGATDHDQEVRSTHPASIRRYADFLDGIAEKMRDTDGYRQKFGYEPTQKMLDEINDIRQRARTFVPD